jgi:glucosylglycerate synthase
MSETASAATDIIVGIPADGRVTPDTGSLAHALGSSLARQSPVLRCRVVLAHSGAGDTTGSAVAGASANNGDVAEVRYALQPSDALNLPYHGMNGRARALQAILQEAHVRRARGCVIVDPRTAMTPGGLDDLLAPLVEDSADFVSPLYSRHPFTGALIHGVVYPVFRALYGARLRYPIGADFSCSPRLIEAVLDEPVWQSDGAQIGIDLWLSATAASGGYRLAQALAGPGSDERPQLDLSTTLSQVVGFLFSDMERRVAIWQRIRGSRPVRQFGKPQHVPDGPDIDVAALIESFRLASRELQDVWAEVLPPLAMLQWRRLAGVPVETFRVDQALWARTIYDFAMGHRLRVIARDHLLRSLTPLYLAWLASFILEVRHLGAEEAEARIERLCAVFETEKPYLVSQWRWPERFKPVKLRR